MNDWLKYVIAVFVFLHTTLITQIFFNNNIIDIKQNGNNTEVVNQLGNKNYYSFINYYNNSPLNLNILQKGNSNNLQIYGQNSLIENMSIVQKSNSKTIIIKNY